MGLADEVKLYESLWDEPKKAVRKTSKKHALTQAKKSAADTPFLTNAIKKPMTEAVSATASSIISRYNNNVADHILELEHERAFNDAEWFEDNWYVLENVEVYPDYYKLIVDRPIESDIDAEAIISYAFEPATIVGMDKAMSDGGVVYDEGDNWIYVERWVIAGLTESKSSADDEISEIGYIATADSKLHEDMSGAKDCYIVFTGNFPNNYFVHGIFATERQARDVLDKVRQELSGDIELAQLFDLTQSEAARLASMAGKEVTGADADFIAQFFTDGSRVDSLYNNFTEAVSKLHEAHPLAQTLNGKTYDITTNSGLRDYVRAAVKDKLTNNKAKYPDDDIDREWKATYHTFQELITASEKFGMARPFINRLHILADRFCGDLHKNYGKLAAQQNVEKIVDEVLSTFMKKVEALEPTNFKVNNNAIAENSLDTIREELIHFGEGLIGQYWISD